MSKSTQRQTTAYVLGKQAKKEGKDKKDNPYKRKSSILSTKWYHGWKAADKEE